ncbi:cell division protein SepF [Spiroplasma platyhelix]|uniref:Cell division protein SepF n=1 Tax=Spiroplasma platyhelix PALS-1 TaxID=1276218 RepID=A0A846TPV6_9MOLU|nr:cell division protein SepF [Spiroplasma platyhelix]MBE4703947.1 Cell division protein SepF [Spiroplasma platyhelix PALS-1]NKE38320.1 cell division protein SepF [Spiroplasma platyhelix PALS-1]UJB29205.1 hypothetical protein SPLAT_v1c04410 [Spiroplasma platyhelix PALS-1]
MAAWWKIPKVSEKTETEALTTSNNPFISNKISSTFEEFSPKNYEDVEAIANALVLQKLVKLNLQNTVISDRRRIIDFLCGIAYVLNFDVKKNDIDVYEFKPNK